MWFAEAAEVGRVPELERAAALEALGDLSGVPEDVHVAVNLSPTTVMAPAFHDVLAAAPEERLVVEITEHAPVEDYEALADRLRGLREHGGRVAIDDVGAGFASLRHILRLEPDIIKLDITLTRGVDHDPAVRAMAAALVAFASEYGAAVVAEGIETPQELDALRSLGVEFGQGYFLARPTQLRNLFGSPT